MARFLPFMLAVSGVLAGVAAVGGFIFAGGAGALGAAGGVVFIAVAYTLSTVFITWAETVNRNLVLVAGITAYMAKLIALFVLLNEVFSAGWPGARPMVFGVAAAALVWIAAQMWWLTHAKIPYVDLGDPK